MLTACPILSILPDRDIVGAARCDRFGDDADANVVNFPCGAEDRMGSVLMRLFEGSWDRIVLIVLRTNCWRVIRCEEEISTTWRSVLRRKIEYASGGST